MKALVMKSGAGLIGRCVSVRFASDMIELDKGERVTVKDNGGRTLGTAVAQDLWRGDLAACPGSIMEMNADPLGRTYSGLVMQLRIENPKLNVTPDSDVVALVMDFTPSKLAVVR